MKETKIQWCHSTVNPVMGCDGCELWPGRAQVVAGIQKQLQLATDVSRELLESVIRRAVADRHMSEIYRDRESVAGEIGSALELTGGAPQAVVDVIRRNAKCYAGLLGTFRAGHKGYADNFESPQMYPGRLAAAARWEAPTGDEIDAKPWLEGLPRLIFISDMGDALSNGIPFEYLQSEIVDHVSSVVGRRHIWLWLTKRPARMARFGEWLTRRGVAWPDNLVAMTTVTEQRFAHRVDQLRRVPSQLKGLSLEPLSEPVSLDLRGIDWTIVGGGSDVLAEPFHAEWALALQRQCESEGVAFFLKQLGKHPFHRGKPLELADQHGGNWNEWPKEWRVREFPTSFRRATPIASPAA